jgi:hypothetical protein
LILPVLVAVHAVDGTDGRQPPKPLGRLLYGIRVPTREQDLQQLPPLEGIDLMRACLFTVMILSASMIVVTGIASLVSQAVT